MFITLAFLLLLAHVPSLQATPIEKKNSTGSNQPTPHTISLNLPKPVTTLINTKQKSPPTSTKATPTKATTTKATPTKPSQVNKSVSPPAKPTPSSGQKTDKDKPAANSQPITVVISEGCVQKDQQKDVINSTKAQEKELSLKPGSPLVMTHRINLLPGGACTGGCEAEMAALKGRVEFLEKEMSALKKKCTACTGGQCPNNCSNQGKCEGGKCICHQGFSGPDCSTTPCPSNCNKKGKCVKGKCVCQQGYTGPDCRKGGDKRVKVTVETVTMKVPPEKEGTSSRKKTQLDKTIFLKKTDEKGHKQTVKADVTKPTVKQGDKTNLVKVQSNGTTTGKVVKTVGQVLLKHQGERHQEQATKGKTTIIKLGSEKHLKPDNKKVSAKQESVKKPNVRKENLKDHPVIQNVTQTLMKKSNRTSKVIFGGSDKGPKGSLNATVSVTKVVKTVGTQGSNVTDKTRVKISHGKGRVTINATSTEKDKKLSQSNVTTVLRGGAFGKKNVENQVNVTVTESKTHTKLSNRTSSKSTALGSVEVHNITSTGFILRWEAPQGMFKNFTVMRRELHIGGKEKDEQDVEATEKSHDTVEKLGSKGTLTMNVTESQKQSSNKTVSSAKAQSASGVNTDVKSMKKFSQVLSGTARSFHFRNLRPQTRYSISLFGSSPGSRSKIYRLTVSTGPEPPTDLVFSNITETSLSVSWTKPKSLVTAFKVMYASPAKGENGSMLVDSQLSHVLLSNLSPGSSYEISVSSSQDMTESEPVTATVVTVPDSPANLQAVNITDTKALLLWKPSQAKVDRYILSYGSTKSPNVTVTVMVSGNAVEHQLRGLHRSTLYTVKVMSQINSLQSKVVSTAFRTASGVKPQAVTAGGVTSNSAVISWKSPRLAFKSYRLTYQQAGQLAKEVILNPTVTQYELTGLHADTNYTVKVDGETEGLYIVVVSTEFSTAKLPYPFPADCSEVQLNGVQKSGEAEVYPEGGDGEPVWVYCDMETEGGGWTVFQRRMDGKTDFYRGWKDYGKGFGHLSAEFWLGNDLLHALTSLKPMSLRIDLRAGNDTAYAHYSNFSVDSEANNYAIEISGYSGTAGDSMRYHNGRPFSTRDRDPSPLSIHCAKAYRGGWWYKNCYKANLNGLYATFSENQGVVWIDWRGKDASIPFTEMKLRPASITHTSQG